MGILPAADWEVGTGRVVAEDREAPARPATTAVRAKMRMASFMFGNLFRSWIHRRILSRHKYRVASGWS